MCSWKSKNCHTQWVTILSGSHAMEGFSSQLKSPLTMMTPSLHEPTMALAAALLNDFNALSARAHVEGCNGCLITLPHLGHIKFLMPSFKPLAWNSYLFTFASMVLLLMKWHMAVPITTILVVIALPVKWPMETPVETLVTLMTNVGISLDDGCILGPFQWNSGIFDMTL